MSLLAARDERIATRVGYGVLAVIAAATIFFAFAFHRIDWRETLRVEVTFGDVGGLREGAPFVVGGREVGRVERIAPVNGKIVVTVAMPAADAGAIHVRADRPDFFIGSRGIVSQRFLELGAVPIEAPLIANGDRLLGADPATLDSVMTRTMASMAVTRLFAEAIRPEVTALRAQIAALRENLAALPDTQLGTELAGLVGEAFETRDALGGADGIQQMRNVAGEARATIAQLRVTLDALSPQLEKLKAKAAKGLLDPKVRTVLARAEPLVNDMRVALAKGETLLADVEVIHRRITRGEGSIIKLVLDPEFPEDFKELGKVVKRTPWHMIHPGKG